jgi:hypothetical protein
MSKRAFSELRDVKVSFDNVAGAMGIDAFKAALNQVEEFESAYFEDNTIADLIAGVVICTGTSRYKLYSFTLTTTFATGVYAFVYVETVPNAEGLS